MLSTKVIVACATLVLVVSGFPVEQSRTGRGEKAVSVMLDRVNIDTYLKNTRAVKQQIKCVLHDGQCDAVGKTASLICIMCMRMNIIIIILTCDNVKLLIEQVKRSRN